MKSAPLVSNKVAMLRTLTTILHTIKPCQQTLFNPSIRKSPCAIFFCFQLQLQWAAQQGWGSSSRNQGGTRLWRSCLLAKELQWARWWWMKRKNTRKNTYWFREVYTINPVAPLPWVKKFRANFVHTWEKENDAVGPKDDTGGKIFRLHWMN